MDTVDGASGGHTTSSSTGGVTRCIKGLPCSVGKESRRLWMGCRWSAEEDLFQSHLGPADCMVRGHSRREQLRQSVKNLKLTWQVARTTIYTDPAFCRVALAADGTRPQHPMRTDRKQIVASYLCFRANWKPETDARVNNSNLPENLNWQIPGRTFAVRPN